MANRSNSNTKKEPKKPWLVRGLNKLGVSTSSGVEWLLGWVQALGVAGIAAWGGIEILRDAHGEQHNAVHGAGTPS